MVQNLTSDLEQVIIACYFEKPILCQTTLLKEEYFTNNYIKLIFRYVMECYKENNTVDILLIYQRHSSELGTNFITFMTDCITKTLTTAPFENYEEQLFENYKNGIILKTVNDYTNKKVSREELFNKLDDIKGMTLKIDTKFYSQEEIFHIITKEDRRIHFDFKILDNTLRLTEHDFLVIGARPGVGKTGLALNLLESISKKYKTIYFNMEMSEQQLLRRLVSINSGVPIKYFNNFESKYQKEKVIDSSKELSKRNIKIVTSVQTVSNIKRVIINESKQEHTVVFIDYVGLIRATEKNKSIYENMTSIVKELRQISMNYNCTIICLAQINRNGTKNEIPMLSDLKDTGELEQSAVEVILLHNPNDKPNIDGIDELQLIVAKNRNGKTGIKTVEYNKNNQKIIERNNFDENPN